MALVRRSSTISRGDVEKNTPIAFSSHGAMRNSPRSSLPDIHGSSPRRDLPRRSSMSSMITPTSGPRRLSFNFVTKRVTNLLKFTMKVKPKISPIPEVDSSVSGEIKELPKSPRFSSFLSPEAQFAMMKGYEDVLHQEISASQPEVRPHLRRNRTPVHTIEIKDAENEKATDATLPCSVVENEKENPRNNLKKPEDTRRSLPLSPGVAKIGKSSTQSESSHHIIPRDRRLVLTYRLESAMDILDNMRYQSGSHFISPRLPVNKREITPATEYNCWTSVWRTEFKCGGKRVELPRQVK